MKKTTYLTLIVDVQIPHEDLYDAKTLEKDLVGHLMKVKSGIYENLVSGVIAMVQKNGIETVK